MANIILIEDDSKLDRQIRSFLNELGDDQKIDSFRSAKEFEDRYFQFLKPHPPGQQPPAPSDEAKGEKGESDKEEAEDTRLTPIDLVIFKNNCVDKDVVKWVIKVQNILQANHFWPENNRTRFIVVKYEDDGLPKAHFLHQYIDDMVLLPLDRLVFLQKVEIVLGLPNNTSPSFLFTQDLTMDIEISKRSRIERLSDVGLAIRNPVSLVSGLMGHFFFKFPDSKSMLDVYGKVHTCVPHPENKDEFLVYFTFFGIDKDTLSQIRRFLMSKSDYKPLVSQDSKDFMFNPHDIFISEEAKQRKNVVVLDFDATRAESLRAMIQEDLAQVVVLTEHSYSRFLQSYLSDGKVNENVVPASVGDFYADSVAFSIALDSDNLVSVENPGKDPNSDQVLGYSTQELFSNPTAWLKLFSEKGTELILREMIEVAKGQQTVSDQLSLKNKNGTFMATSVTVAPSEEKLIITLKPPENVAQPPPATATQNLESIDLMIVNEHLIPTLLEPWLDGLHEAARKKGLVKKDQNIKIIVISDSHDKKSLERFHSPRIYGLYLQPVEKRALLYGVTAGLNSPFSMYRFDNIGWADTLLQVNLGKKVVMERMSEFGCMFRHNRPMAAGTAIFLHDGIFTHAPDGNLCSRVYFSEPHPKEKDEYLISTMYFGINDAFLRAIRSWIRENYASKKAEQN